MRHWKLARLRAVVVIGIAIGVSGVSSVSTAAAGPAPTLCASDASRGVVSAAFPVDACIDSSSVWIQNTLPAPVQLSLSGDTQAPVRMISAPASLAGDATRISFPTPLLLLPGDVVRVPFGSGAASVSVANTDASGFYATALAAQSFVRGSTSVGAFASLVDAIDSVYADVQRCLDGGSVDAASCRGQLARGVARAVTGAAAPGLSNSVVSVLHDWSTFAASAAGPSLGTERTIAIAARHVASPLAGLRYHAVFTATPYTPLNAVCGADPLFAHGFGDQFSLQQLSPSDTGLTLEPQTGFLPYSIVFLRADQQVTSIVIAAMDLHAADGSMVIENAFGTSVGSCGGAPIPAGVPQSFHATPAFGPSPACGTLAFTRTGDTFVVDVAYTDC